jgi:hypothetical protein
MLKRLIVLLLPIALLTVGCDLSEDMSECGVLRLNMRYILNGERVDHLADYVGDVRIYVFDQTRTNLVEIVRPTRGDIQRGYTEIENPAAGEFTFVAWAGGGTDIVGSGYMEVDMDDPANSQYRQITHDGDGSHNGETTLESFYMMIEHDDIAALPIVGEARPKTNQFVDLFHSSTENFLVVEGQQQTINFDFVRNTNILDILVTGLDNLESASTRAEGEDPLGLFTTGRNGRYKWNNTIDPYARMVRYESVPHESVPHPTDRPISANEMHVDIKTLHMNQVRHKDDPILLHLADPVTGADLATINVIEAIIQVRDNEGNFLYRTQEDIDREYVFPIRIEILPGGIAQPGDGRGGIRVFVNDWEIENLDPVVEGPSIN